MGILSCLPSVSRSTRNVIWNVLGGLWTGILVVLATPWYVSNLGLDGYGILSLWLVMQVMMGLLDVGMGATVIKEFAGVSPEGIQGLSPKRDLLRTLEVIYWSLAILLVMGIVAGAGVFSERWLQIGVLPSAKVAKALRLMGLTLGLQFPFALYSNGLAGLQAQGRMNAIQIAGNTLRHGVGLLIVFLWQDLALFFAAQVLVAGVQTFYTRWVLWKQLGGLQAGRARFQVAMVKRVWRFSLGMAFTSVSGVLLANADRLFLSKMLPTGELGRYAVAFTASGLLQLGIQPFYRAFFPRYAELVSSRDEDGLRTEYFRSCSLMATVILPLGVVGWLYAPQLLHAWMGRHDSVITSTFRLLLIGITGSGMVWLPAAYQQAHGWTRLHGAMIAGALVLGIPIMPWAIQRYGVRGATTVWIIHGLSGITLELWLLHRKLLKGDLVKWLLLVLIRPLVVALPVAWLTWCLMPPMNGRWYEILWVGLSGAVVMTVTSFMTVLLSGRLTIPHKDA